MNQLLRKHADQIVREAIAAVQPDAAVERALKNMEFPGRVLLVAAGKAAWRPGRWQKRRPTAWAAASKTASW